ncbi:MAG: imidazole glycerol phosphate synthase subunit HisH [Verrucomicrobiae bacterium]|nr:imidazole glycerol phosphate synthase subunit HisH [Verrucomicrobiae bacterium]
MIALIDYGAGNLRSVHRALVAVGAQVELVTAPERVHAARAVVLPGVGAFDDCACGLAARGLIDACKQFIETGGLFLGICIGYQILFERSEEFNSTAPGFGYFKGKVVRFTERPGLKIPQIGWNRVELVRPDCPLFEGIPDGSYFYFVHSFYPVPVDESIVAGRTAYGDVFASAVWCRNVYAVQFHPEKSQKVGLQLLRNFVRLAEAKSQGDQ